MKDWKEILIPPGSSIFKAIETINQGSLQVALIVDDGRRLLGMLTDGDVRRAILQGVPLTEPVEKVMSRKFTVANVEDSRERILSLMQEHDLRHIPVLDAEGRLVDLKMLMHMVESRPKQLDNWVVLMAGGLGARLRPLTEESPKPLLNVGGRPLLETIICNMKEYGLYRYFVSVNYKAPMIEEYFGDGTKLGAEITYLREIEPLGTAGALSILPQRPKEPVFVMNSDLLTKVNFRQLLEFHIEKHSIATMCVREIDLKIPYGVVNADGFRLINLEEKPVKKLFINAGIYVLEPDAIDLVPKNEFFDMTTLFESLQKSGKKAMIFPIHEYWLDIGRVGDYEKANGDYCKHFQ